MIPMILKLRSRGKSGKRPTLWLPLFLVWIIVLPLLVIPAPFIMLAALIMWPSGRGHLVFHAYLTIFRIIGCLSGFEMDIESRNSTFFIVLK